MSGSAGVFAVCVVACATAVAHAQNSLRAGASLVTAQQVEQQFHSELRVLLGHGDAASTARLERLQMQMRPMYSALPKGEDGGLERGAARYALHRFFAQQHGWHVRGLEAVGAEKWGDAASTAMLEERIPSYVLELFEHRGGRTGLRELAVLAATLEDLVHSEAIQLLSKAYAAQGLSIESSLEGKAQDLVIATYLLFHIMPNPKYASLSTERLNQILQRAPKFYTGWEDTVLWVHDLQETMRYDERNMQNPFAAEESISQDFNSLVRLVEGVGEQYGQFQNLECRGMKNTLLDLSDGTGRVRLSKFYEAAYENRSQHFSESPEYLRHLGALDETDPKQPSVIVTNYMYARANCLASSSFYSICCIDECESLLAELERQIASPYADPVAVMDLVAGMSSDTLSAPRNLSTALHRRLNSIAERHGGYVPLHGRLFAQWMHHAFPNECPYPHAPGSLASPLTPAEWLHAEPEVKRRLKASMEEMQLFVDLALGANESDSMTFEEESVLPWTDEEELLVAVPVKHPMGKASSWLRLIALALAVASAAAGLIRMLQAAPVAALPMYSGRAGKVGFLEAVLGSGHKSLYV